LCIIAAFVTTIRLSIAYYNIGIAAIAFKIVKFRLAIKRYNTVFKSGIFKK